MKHERGQWGSRIGFILAAAGSAIGLGAIWKFPYMAGANGGGAFVCLYLASVFGIGVSMMLAELAMGRFARRNAVEAFRSFGGKKGGLFGYSSLVAAFLILAFYCVVGGWTCGYLLKALTGTLLLPEGAQAFALQFQSIIGAPVNSLVFLGIFLALTMGIVLGGVKEGIERFSKVLMPLLFCLMFLMIIRSVTLPGASAGIRFLFFPDFTRLTPRVLVDALGFACFSLSLGFGAMLTYGSYIGDRESLGKAAFSVVCLQTVCTLLAGLMIMPAVFALGMQPESGPGLTYIILPAVFKAMPGGSVFAVIFFALLLIAALTSSVSIVEPIVAYCIERYLMPRKKAAAGVGVAGFVAAIPAAWSFGGGAPTLFGMTPFALMDAVTSNIMLPVNVLAACILMGAICPGVFRFELYQRNREERTKYEPAPRWAAWVELCCRYVAPAVIAAVLFAALLKA